jgi:hypothetical protein
VEASRTIEALKSESTYISSNIDTAKVVFQTLKTNISPISTNIQKIGTDYVDPFVTFVSLILIFSIYLERKFNNFIE